MYEFVRRLFRQRLSPEQRLAANRKKLAAKWNKFANASELSFCRDLFTDDGDIKTTLNENNLSSAFVELVGLRSELYFTISYALTLMAFLAVVYFLLLVGGFIVKPLMKEPPTPSVILIYKSLIGFLNVGILAVVASILRLTRRRNLVLRVEKQVRAELLWRYPPHVPVKFTEDFSHGLGKWNYEGNWSIVKDGGSNVLVVTGSDAGGYARECHAWEDYIVEFETKIVNEWSAWIIRAKDNETYVMLQCGQNMVRVHFRVNGKWSIAEPIALSVTLPPNKWFGVRIVVRTTGVKLTLTVDGKKLDVTGLPSNMLSSPNARLDHNFGSFGFREWGGECAHFRKLSAMTLG
jgi:hypothetical protein